MAATGKVAELNLEQGNPTVAVAIQNLKNSLTTYKARGVKAVIVIHGYGSSGVGGGIKAGVQKCLSDNAMRGIVRLFVGGESWSGQKKSALTLCGSLESYDRRVSGNSGVTVVILR